MRSLLQSVRKPNRFHRWIELSPIPIYWQFTCSCAYCNLIVNASTVKGHLALKSGLWRPFLTKWSFTRILWTLLSLIANSVAVVLRLLKACNRRNRLWFAMVAIVRPVCLTLTPPVSWYRNRNRFTIFFLMLMAAPTTLWDKPSWPLGASRNRQLESSLNWKVTWCHQWAHAWLLVVQCRTWRV